MANVHLEEIEQEDSLLEIEYDDVGLKQFPCCGSTHPAIKAMLELRTRGLKAEDVEAIEIVAHRRRLPHTNNPKPSTPLGAKLSIQYATVRALLNGAPRLQHFDGESFLEPAAQDLLARVTTRAFAEDSRDRRMEMACEVIVRTRGGETLTGRAESVLGRGYLDPMSGSEMWEKFSDCASCVLTEEQSARAYEALTQLATCENVVNISKLLVPSKARV